MLFYKSLKFVNLFLTELIFNYEKVIKMHFYFSVHTKHNQSYYDQKNRNQYDQKNRN